ncbi:MAG: hypothetical protein GY816_10980 [Cytophagales bacterium]|nr:hypothetical protein [Cytophagales bacterium]
MTKYLSLVGEYDTVELKMCMMVIYKGEMDVIEIPWGRKSMGGKFHRRENKIHRGENP